MPASKHTASKRASPSVPNKSDTTSQTENAINDVVKQNSPTSHAIEDVVKKKRSRPDKSEFFTPNCKPGEISKMLAQAVEISRWPSVNTDDPDQVAQRFDQYHSFCIQNDIKPDMPGLALSLGVTRKTLWAWENGYESNKPQSVRNVIKKAREINEIMMTQMMANGKINPVAGIFFLKNSHGYTDEQSVVITPNNPMDQMDTDTARKRLMDAIPADDDE